MKERFVLVYCGNSVCLIRDNGDGTNSTLTPEQIAKELNEYDQRVNVLCGVIAQLEKDIDEMEEAALKNIQFPK
jgi:hypothetical protein